MTRDLETAMPSFDDLQLDTPRLVLRPPRASDLDAWSEMMLDEPVARFIGGVMPRSLCWRALMTMIGACTPNG
jgi:RimJ/RimL family protein N-acetyltransferase